MRKKIARSYFSADSVLFVGYSSRNIAFCKSVREAFERAGTRVLPVNPSGNIAGEPVFPSIEAASAEGASGSVDFAVVLTKKERNLTVADELAKAGVKRVAFANSMCADRAVLDKCEELGLEAVVACPLMALGGGLHRFHGFLAGVR